MSATPPADPRTELTIRGLILGALITLVFTAANVYLGLKAGLTFASSIPAAVISMGVLRAFKTASIQENNIVQTVASAAGTLSSIIFVLPGLVMIGWWTGFPFWASFGVCALGGVLGVMYSIPLRRALVTDSPLPYPEGVAAAEVLKVGAGSRENATEAAIEGKAGLIAVVAGSAASALFAIGTAMRLFAANLAIYFRVGTGATGADFGLSLALMGVGHLVGLSVGMAMVAGLLIAWAAATPILTMLHPMAGPAADVAQKVWHDQVRFMGAGSIGVAALWTLAKLVAPVLGGLRSALAASRVRKAGDAASLPRTEQDIPIGIVALVSTLTLAPLAWLLWTFLQAGGLGALSLPLIAGALAYIVVTGFLVAAVCGYMAGLIGSSNSPLSGVGILAVIGAALLLTMAKGAAGPAGTPALVAFALFVTAVVFTVATIANDNLQDLKTGQLVDATPWRQQVALVFGVLVGAAVIPPILDLLNHAYGFAGTVGVHTAAAQALPAPQATLISALAKGVLQGELDWGLIGWGALVGVAVIAVDEALRLTGRMRLPPLAVGLGIYLPMATTLPIAVGAVIGWAYDKRADKTANPAFAKRLGVLLASGLIVGESLFGVALAGLIVGTGKGTPLAVVGDSFNTAGLALGAAVFTLVLLALYRRIERLGRA